MSTTKKLVLGAVAIVFVLIALVSLGGSSTVSKVLGQAGWPVHNTPEIFSQGQDTGDGNVTFTKGGIIGPGANQASWRNTLGRTVYVNPAQVAVGFTSGTASSSLLYYVSTSSAATLTSDFAHPGGSVWGIDGASIATSTPGPSLIMGTTTSSGAGIPVADGAYLNVQIQSKNGGTCNGAACETATSTNRGITNFFWRFTGFYKP